MYKKILCLFLAFSLIGCSNSKDNDTDSKEVEAVEPDTESRVVNVTEAGLKYETPNVWRNYEQTNIYPTTVVSTGTFLQIKYNFISEEDISKINNIDTAGSEFLKPVCEIVVLEEANVEMPEILNLFSEYLLYEEVGYASGYAYYLLWDYLEATETLSESDQKIYNEMVNAVPQMIESIEVNQFDPTILQEKNKALNNNLQFATTTLDGEIITDDIFANADVTLFNFGAIYAHDETEILQQLSEEMELIDGVQMITAFIDAGDTDLELAKSLRENTTFKTIILDRSLGDWAVANLTGVPTTVFVDRTGLIIGEEVQGAKTVDIYLAELENHMLK